PASRKPEPEPETETATRALPVEGFGRFAAVADAVRASTRRTEKVAQLARYLGELTPEDAALAAVFFTGRPFPQSDPRTLTLGWSAVKRAVLEAAGMNDADFRAAYQRFADSGDAAEAVLAGRTRPATASLAAIAGFFAEVAADRGPAAKLERLQARLATLTA